MPLKAPLSSIPSPTKKCLPSQKEVFKEVFTSDLELVEEVISTFSCRID